MSTLKEITDNIYAVANQSSDDTDIDKRSIRFWIKNKRAMILKRRLAQNLFISDTYRQSIPCVELELVDVSQSNCCIGLSIGCKVLRSVQKIPNGISQRGVSLANVRPLNVMDNKFAFVTRDRWTHSGNSRFDKSDIFITKIDDYIYVKSNNPSLQNLFGKYVYIDDVFDDPEELVNFTDCSSGDVCYSSYMDYPIEQDMVDIITQDILRNELNINLSIPEDNTNDGENTKAQMQTKQVPNK